MSADERTRQLIWKLIDSKGESQQEFSDAIGATRSLVSQWKTGKSNSFSNSRYISKIADHFGVTTDYLLGTNILPEESRSGNGDAELNEYLSELKNRREMRQLFKVAKSATKQDVEQAVRIIEALKGPRHGGET